MSPNRPSAHERSDERESITVRVSRELQPRGTGGDVQLSLHPCTTGEPPRASLVDEAACAKLRRAILDAFDVTGVPALRELGSDRFERNLCIGTAIITEDDVRFEPNESLLTESPALA